MPERSVSVRRSARVVVLGAGFAGASLLRHLPPALRRPGETLLIDRREEYAFVPLIHEVAVGRVHPRTVSSPIAPLRRCLPVPALGSLGYRPHPEDPRNPEGPVGYEYLVLNPGSVAAEPGPRLRITSTPSGAWTMRCACAPPWRCLAPATSPGPGRRRAS